MNFQKIPPVETSKHFLDLAFSKARRKGKSKKLVGNWLQIIRKKEALKLDVIKDDLVTRLEKIVQIFPDTSVMSSFYIKLMHLTLDYPRFKKSLGSLDWALKKIRLLHKSYVRKVVKEKNRTKIKELSLQFYGRISSVLKQIDPNLRYLEACRKIMRTYPDVKEMFTVCIYGFPNVGKTTLLNKLTPAKAKTAAYAFTTKTINAGYFTLNKQKIQIFDVPGTLARKEKMNLIELQAELVRKDLADLIVYVFDLSETSGYPIKKQEQLWKQIGKNKVLVYLSKKDLLSPNKIKEFPKKHYPLEKLKQKIYDLAKKGE